MSATPSLYIEKATQLLERAENEADIQKAQLYHQIANSWLQLEQLERYAA